MLPEILPTTEYGINPHMKLVIILLFSRVFASNKLDGCHGNINVDNLS